MREVLTVKDLRPSVVAFAIEMERELRANAHKGNRPAWRADPVDGLLNHLDDEVRELADVAYRGPGPHMTPLRLAAVREEAADVANMALMVADSVGALDLPEGAE